MTTFTAGTVREAVVPTDRREVWTALTDPDLLPRLTPFLHRIDASDGHWRWEMARIPVLGVGITPSFTERMTFDPEHRIDFTHDPPPGRTERTGVEGWYVLEDQADGTRLSTSLSISVDLPLPRSSGVAVRHAMRVVVDRMGDRFAGNLLDHLGVEAGR